MCSQLLSVIVLSVIAYVLDKLMVGTESLVKYGIDNHSIKDSFSLDTTSCYFGMFVLPPSDRNNCGT
jgi:hypothetical protein